MFESCFGSFKPAGVLKASNLNFFWIFTDLDSIALKKPQLEELVKSGCHSSDERVREPVGKQQGSSEGCGQWFNAGIDIGKKVELEDENQSQLSHGQANDYRVLEFVVSFACHLPFQNIRSCEMGTFGMH
jgi:hypothetical protein